MKWLDNMMKGVDDGFDNSKRPAIYLITFAHVLYFATYFGLVAVQTKVMSWLDSITQTFICLFLLVRFNPFRKNTVEITQYDKRLIFGSGMLLFSNLVAVNLYSAYNAFRGKINNVYDKIHKPISPSTHNTNEHPNLS